MMQRKNCWEVMKCGREPGGEKAEEFGVCPAAAKPSQHGGINKGTHCGRFCWTVTGTFCHGKKQGTYAQKLVNCVYCEFFQQVRDEEGRDFVPTPPRDTGK